jgi:cytidylate kinase
VRVIAIDGPAGSGKSTVSKALANRLGLDYLDTGAMYRGVAFAALRRGVDPDDAPLVARLAQNIDIDVSDVVTVDGVDATIEIRGPEVTRAVSVVAANPEVRRELRRRQREWASAHGGGVIEGRDIGSVVFPEAELKVYLTASDNERAGRRSKEVLDLDYDTVAADIARRDYADSRRATAPLVVADGAITVDTTGLSVDEVVDRVLALLPDGASAPGSGDETRGAAVTGDGAVGISAADPDAGAPVGQGAEAPADGAQTPVDVERQQATPTESAAAKVPKLAAEDRPLRPGERAFYQFARTVFIIWGRLYWRVTVKGRHNLPTTGPFVVAPVHRSNIDTILMAFVSRRHLRYMAKDTLWRHGWSARLLTALGGFPVNRDTADRDALRTCQSALRRGESVVIFPEGTRKAGPVVTDLYQGAAYVAVREGVPVVPVGIGGSAGAMPKGSMMLRPVKVRIVIGEPIYPPQREGAAGRGIRRQVREMTALLQSQLQATFDEAEGRG